MSLSSQINPLELEIPTRTESSQVLLRCYVPADAEQVLAFLRANADLLKRDFPALSDYVARSDNNTTLLYDYERLWKKREAFHYAIWDKDAQAYAGEASLRNIEWAVPKGEVSYLVGAAFSGRGIASEAVLLLSSLAFTDLRMEKLQIRCDAENLVSQRVAEHCGFNIEGVLRNDMRSPADNTLRTVIYYGMTAEDFRSMQTKL